MNEQMKGAVSESKAAAAQEAVAWSKTKPTAEGAYYVRGFNLFQLAQYEALVQVRTHHFDGEPAPELVCNIHKSTSNAEMDDWSPIVEMSEDFEWLGPLVAAPVAAAPAVDVATLRALADRWANDRSYTGSPVDDIRALIEQPTVSTPASSADSAVLTNPYTGQPRDYRDVESDPAGTLIVEPGKPLEAASTPAAPGIDLEQFRALVYLGMTYGQGSSYRLAAEKLRDLIDASPKGVTMHNDGSSEAQFIADAERLNCTVCGGSGHVDDSPKGGSNVVSEYIAARDAYEEAVKPSGGFGQPKRLCHSDQIILRYRNARTALNALQATSHGAGVSDGD